VWLQNPDHIAEFRGIGINLFVGFWGSLDEASLGKFASANMPLIAEQSTASLMSPQRAAIAGWLLLDEPDNAQPDGHGGYGPCISPAQLLSWYEDRHRKDASRPVLLNFGRGVSDVTWKGRGSCAEETTSYYPEAARAGDIISFDVYPVADYNGQLEMVANGMHNLNSWLALSGRRKIVWNAIEAVPITSGNVPTETQERAEVWMSIVGGAQGIVYFVHQFDRDGNGLVREDGIFNFPKLARAVAAINAEVSSLAPVLNSPTVAGDLKVTSTAPASVNVMVKRYGGATYIFAVNERSGAGAATFAFAEPASGGVEVLGESRAFKLTNGAFTDSFDSYGVHLYRIVRSKG
jgi:hypothetical protein